MIEFKFLILIILFSFTLQKNLFNSKPSEEELKEALKNIPQIYSELYKKMLDHPSEDEKDFTLEYFKKAESTIKTEYIQNIPSSKLIDIIPKIISLCQLDNSNHGMIKDLFENKILGMTDYFKFSPWMSFHFTDSKTVEKNKISFATLITKKEEDKISIYIIYGVADFKRNFFYSYNGISLIGINSGNEYFSSISSASTDFPDPSDETNFYHFFNLIGFKALGKEYGIDLPYPIFY